MKYVRYFIALIFVGAVVLYSGCGGKGGETPDLTEKQKAAKALSTSWGGSEAKIQITPPNNLDRVHYEQLYNLKLTFTVDNKNNPNQFTATGGGTIFPNVSNTAWDITGNGPYTVSITGGQINVLNNLSFSPNRDNPTSITFKFNYTQPAGRTADISGEYTMTMMKF